MTTMTRSPFVTRDMFRTNDGRFHFTGLSPTIPMLLHAAVRAVPQRVAVIDECSRTSYAELWHAASSVAGGLRWDGCRPGDRIVIRMANSAAWIEAYFGVLLAGAVAVPVNPKLTDAEVEFIVEDCGARWVIDGPGAIPRGAPVFANDAAAEDIAAICYTSGTTGRPKGAVLTHANHLSAVEGFCRALESNDGFYDGVRTLIVAPLFHAAGLVIQMLSTVRMAGTSIVQAKFDAGEFLRCIAEERVESVFGVPAMLHEALNHPTFGTTDVTSVRNVLYGAAPVPPALIRRLMSAFPGAKLGNGYGMTELSPASFLPHRDADRYPNSVGFPTPGTEILLRDVDDDGVGELLVRGPQVMAGYWNQPTTSAPDHDGWMPTGDLCRIDDEGRVYVVDRAKDMIIRGGENVYCVEVEDAIAGIDGVVEASVVGVPDERLGERVAALVVTRPDVELSGLDVIGRLANTLATYKLPEFVVLRTEPLPRNAGGKVLKSLVREDATWNDVTPLRITRTNQEVDPS